MPTPHVCNNAMLKCAMAVPPGTSNLVVLPLNKVMTGNQPAANIMDHKPFLNILPFGMCMSPANPAFVAATSAALGTPTPVPCTPVTTAPWVPGSPMVMMANAPALNMTSTLMCNLGGVITILVPGEFTEIIP